MECLHILYARKNNVPRKYYGTYEILKFEPFLFLCADTGCQNVDCHGHGRCVILEGDVAMCQCYDNRYGHASAAAPGDCSVETQNSVSCQNGGSCM